MIADLLELSLVEGSAGTLFEEPAELCSGAFFVVERPRRSSRGQVQATVHVVEHFVRNRSVAVSGGLST